MQARDVLRALQTGGFVIRRTTGSHYILRHPDGRFAVVPYHSGRALKRGTLRSIIKQAGLTIEEFSRLL